MDVAKLMVAMDNLVVVRGKHTLENTLMRFDEIPKPLRIEWANICVKQFCRSTCDDSNEGEMLRHSVSCAIQPFLGLNNWVPSGLEFGPNNHGPLLSKTHSTITTGKYGYTVTIVTYMCFPSKIPTRIPRCNAQTLLAVQLMQSRVEE